MEPGAPDWPKETAEESEEPRPEKRARTQPRPRVYYTPLVPMPSMQPEDLKRAYWSALYELWRLSWYQIPHDHTFAPPAHSCRDASDYGVVKHVVPQPVFMWDWLKAVDHGDMLLKSMEFGSLFPIRLTDYLRPQGSEAPAMPDAQRKRCETWCSEAAAALDRTRLSPTQFTQVAGALIKTGMVGTRFRSSSVPRSETRNSTIETLVYYIDPAVAANIQRFINLSPLIAFSDPIRPGHEGCGDQLPSVQAAQCRGPVPQITQFNNLMVRRHIAWASAALDHSIQLTTAEVNSARRHYPL